MTVILVAAALALALSAYPQGFTGAVTGTLTDTTGAVLPEAKVTLINARTEERRTQAANAEGGYVFPAVPPGTYRLEAEHSGFKKFVRKDIAVEVGQQVVIDIGLAIGQVVESVEVVATTPLLQPTTSSLGQVVDSRKILELPLVGRNTLGLIGLTAGAQPVGQFGSIPARGNAYQQGFFSTTGSQVLTDETLIDGAPANAAVFNAPAYVPVVDDVQEFKVQTSNVSAEFGRTGGGVVNIVTRSGGNHVHGSLYEFFRNDHLDANSWFNNRAGQKKPHNSFNQFGGSAGGPIIVPGVYDGRNRSFWFFNYEGLRESRGLTQLFTVPTPAQLQGDFSQTYNSSGQLIAIYNPFTTRPDPNNPGRFIRDPFDATACSGVNFPATCPGNKIPSNLIDPVAAKMRSFWPTPNTAGTRTGANNFIGSGSAPNVQNQFTARVDHIFREKHKVFGRFSLSNVSRGAVDFFGNGAGFVNPGGGGVPLKFNARNFSLDYTYTQSPALLWNLRYGFVRQFVGKTPALTGLDLTTVGFSSQFNEQVYFRALPALQPSGFRALAPATADLIQRADNTHALQGSLTKVLTKHTLKAGADIRFIPIGELQPNAPQGAFNFDSRFTGQNPLSASANSGSSVASFLLGVPSSGSADFNPAVSISYSYFGGYIQDDFRVSSKLTLNLGMRYELETPRNERYNRLSWFNPDAPSPIAQQVGLPALRGGLQFPGVAGQPRRQKETDKNNFGPRFGIAYSINPKTAVRGAYGVFFLPSTGDDTGRFLGGEGFFASTTFVSSLDGGITPADRLSNPFPRGLSQPPGSSQGLTTLLGQGLETVIRTDRTAYTQQWNLNLQRELPGGFLLDIAYAGSRGVKLPVNIQLNQLPDQFLAQGSALLTQVTNPFFGLVTIGPLSQPKVAAGQLLRPFPQFDSVDLRAVRAGSSIYHSMQLKVERRFSKGFSLLGAYTVSKLIAVDSSRLAIGFANQGFQDNNNLRAERSLSNIDIPQRLVLSYNWELPFGPDKPFLSNTGSIAAKLVGGWQVNGITTLQHGAPLGLTCAVNQTNSFGGGCRPNSSGKSARLFGTTESRLNRYFDTSVFSQPPPFTFGNTSRTLPNVRSPGLVNLDFSAIKNTRVTEGMTIQFRAEFFNLLNNVNFGSPGTVFGTPTFGVISSAADGRTIQFGLKVLF